MGGSGPRTGGVPNKGARVERIPGLNRHVPRTLFRLDRRRAGTFARYNATPLRASPFGDPRRNMVGPELIGVSVLRTTPASGPAPRASRVSWRRRDPAGR